MNDATDKHTPETVEAFIDRWQDTGCCASCTIRYRPTSHNCNNRGT